jgi:hypothetical protein
MDPLPFAPYPLAPGSQNACYLPWPKVSVALRYVRTFPWAPEARGAPHLEGWMVQLRASTQ